MAQLKTAYRLILAYKHKTRKTHQVGIFWDNSLKHIWVSEIGRFWKHFVSTHAKCHSFTPHSHWQVLPKDTMTETVMEQDSTDCHFLKCRGRSAFPYPTFTESVRKDCFRSVFFFLFQALFFLTETHQNSGVKHHDFRNDSPPWEKDARSPFDTVN